MLEIMKKLYTSKTFSKTASGRRHTPHPNPLGPLLAINYNNHQKSMAYFSHMAPLILLIFYKKNIVKRKEPGGGGELFCDIIIIGKESSIAFSAI